ncbi:hypothetical protein BD413DRAFT_474099 [Trametes elegans]|nr:hypothetical protein BD413DRAFT_474099 [Trametes elegans]
MAIDQTPRLTVAIVCVFSFASDSLLSLTVSDILDTYSGAGLGGLALAIALEKYAPDVAFDIYDAVAELSTAGAGIGMQPRTWLTIKELGLEDALLKIAGNGDKPTYYYSMPDPPSSAHHFATFHRSELQKVFLEHIRAKDRLHLSKRFVSYTQPVGPEGQVQVHFADGTSVTCDVLVGGDGIKSRVRSALYTQLSDAAQARGRYEQAEELRSCIAPVFSGLVVYRGVITRGDYKGKERPLNDSNFMMVSLALHLVAYPIMQGSKRLLNISAIVTTPQEPGTLYRGPWTVDVTREEATSFFSGWEPEVEDILEVHTWNRWAVNMVKDLPTFVSGGVVLLGDAAHAMTMHQGAGAGQGLEDATMLARLLGEPTVNRAALPLALKVYDEERRPLVQQVAARSFQSGNLQMFNVPELFEVTEELSASGEGLSAEQLRKVGDDIERLKEWQKVASVVNAHEVAVQKLKEELAEKHSAFQT